MNRTDVDCFYSLCDVHMEMVAKMIGVNPLHCVTHVLLAPLSISFTNSVSTSPLFIFLSLSWLLSLLLSLDLKNRAFSEIYQFRCETHTFKNSLFSRGHATLHLIESVGQSVRPSVLPSVCPSVRPSEIFLNLRAVFVIIRDWIAVYPALFYLSMTLGV